MGIIKNLIIMKNILIVLAITLFCSQLSAQNSAGQIVYERKTDWIKILSKATHLSKEEKDRMAQTWKNDSEYKQKMVLSFDSTHSHYTYESQQGESEDGSYTWRNDDYIITRDFQAARLVELQATLGKSYVLEDSLKFYNWKIGNDIKDINGYICMNATTYDSTKTQKIEAWFTTDIAVPAGPERFGGLPGLILEINIDNEAVIITPVTITLNKAQVLPKLPKKMKGKKISVLAFNKMVEDFIKQQETQHRFAYWSLRY
jgi:GLPGLI family protein